jgi:nitrate/nitrite transport system substrate-binding protein
MRREFMKRTGAAGLLAMVPPAVRAGAWAGGSDAPEKTDVSIGYIPLTDCAPVVMAARLGLDRKYGLNMRVSREASWSAVRDKLVAGELDAAHVLYGLVYGVQLGIGCAPRDMAVLMTLSANGQGISLSRRLAACGAADGASLARLVHAGERKLVFAQTFPTGTHAMWLNYWLAAHGVDPLREVQIITVPPPQMVANARAGRIDAFCVGEPWNHYGVADGTSVHVARTQDVWADHPEKVLGATREFIERHPNTARAMVAALLEACRWLDASEASRAQMAEVIAGERYVNVPAEVIAGGFPMKFHAGGEVNYPWLSDGMWFMTQFRRWGLLRGDPDYLAVASRVNQIDLYSQAAAQVKVPVPERTMRASRLMDGAVWDGTEPGRYASAHQIHA